jgi:hypothetical protein
MAGTNLEAMFRQGAMQQQQPQQMAAPVVTPGVEQYYVVPQMQQMPQGDMFGAGRFLSGPSIPMTFNVPVPQYESPNLTPGDFQNFMRALGSGKSANYTIPVLNPQTGTYTSTQYGAPSE